MFTKVGRFQQQTDAGFCMQNISTPWLSVLNHLSSIMRSIGWEVCSLVECTLGFKYKHVLGGNDWWTKGGRASICQQLEVWRK
jgi:hypothetical protein